MSTPFRTFILEKFPLNIKRNHYDAMNHYTIGYELRPGVLEAINSPLLGCENMYFHAKDYQGLFDILGIDKEEFKKVIHSHPEVNEDFLVAGDPYNILVVYALYKVEKSELNRSQKEEFKMNLLKMLHYKFFASVVNYMFPHKANRAVMEKTIDSLSDKYAIKDKDTPTWKLVIEKRCMDILASNSIHVKTLDIFPDFKSVAYVITDTQTRIRSRVVNIAMRFHEMNKENQAIGSSSLMQEIDGEKSIRAIEGSYDVMISTITNDALNVNKFIDHSMIEIVVKLTNNIRADMFRGLLMRFSDLAVQQSRKGSTTSRSGKGGQEIITGYKALITEIIQKTYRACVVDKTVNMKSKLQVLEKSNNLYKSSRISDESILVIKNSVDKFVEECEISRRPSTNASLKIGFITYIMLLSFRSQ